MKKSKKSTVSRRTFISTMGAGGLALLAPPWSRRLQAEPDTVSRIFHAYQIPGFPFTAGDNHHAGVEALLGLLAGQGLMFYRSTAADPLAGPEGMIAADDVVLIKVNAQWKYRGCTNSDVIRGLVQRLLDHPDGFRGEVVLVENGQGRGSLSCNTSSAYGGDTSVRANALNEAHSFQYLASQIFRDPRVSCFLLDPIRTRFIGADDHLANGYRRFENVSYPCFTTAGGRRVELREGVWTGSGYSQGLKLINAPVLKHHDSGGSEITAALKHMYGLVSMADGSSGFRHYQGLGETCGKMMVSVRPPVLNIVDAIWVSHLALSGYPASNTQEVNSLAASQDPVALDYWAAKHLLYPIDGNHRHHPDHENIQRWLAAAEATINGRGGLYHPEWGIMAGNVTRDESRMVVHSVQAGPPDALALTSPNGGESWGRGTIHPVTWSFAGSPGAQLRILLLDGSLTKLVLSNRAAIESGSFNWKVPVDLPKGRNYRIRIISRQYPSLLDTSDLPFSVGMAPPGSGLAMASPNGGESWKRGTRQTISWTYAGQPGDTVKIVLLKSGAQCLTIAEQAPLGAGGTGSFDWAIPGNLAAGGDYAVRIRSRAFAECRCQSARSFAIVR